MKTEKAALDRRRAITGYLASGMGIAFWSGTLVIASAHGLGEKGMIVFTYGLVTLLFGFIAGRR